MNVIPVSTLNNRANRDSQGGPRKRLPSWFKVKVQRGTHYQEMRRLVNAQGLHTICTPISYTAFLRPTAVSRIMLRHSVFVN